MAAKKAFFFLSFRYSNNQGRSVIPPPRKNEISLINTPYYVPGTRRYFLCGKD
ncbi:MAG: hypothetical protein ACI8UG_000157 [Gammaproteobacteria bacterium]|jgi:hypothetical protein